MTRYTKSNGKYNISGTKYNVLTGSRAQVWHGTAFKTSGGLKKSDLMKNKAGRIVSKTKFQTAKKEKRLVKHGYGTKKGTFGFVSMKKSRKHKGGAPYGNDYSPSALSNKYDGIDGQGLTKYSSHPSSVDVQLAAGQSGGKGLGWLGSNSTQYAALQAGGKRRKGKKGGRYSHKFSAPGTWNNPQIAALNAS
jgi:hypothetical protein